MNKFLDILNTSKLFNKITESVRDNSVFVNGLTLEIRRHFACSMANALKKPFVFVVQNENVVADTLSDMRFFLGEDVIYFPEENTRLSLGTKSKDIYIERAKVFESLFKGKTPNLVINYGVLLGCFERLSDIGKKIVGIQIGKSYDIEKLVQELTDSGFERADVVEGVGQFAIRGGILDVFSPTSEFPVRIEFFDDEVDSIRLFDAVSQRTVEQIEATDIFPVKNQESEDVSFLEYLSENYLVFLEEPQRLIDKIESDLLEIDERIEKGDEINKKIFSREEIFNLLLKRNAVFLSTLDLKLKEFVSIEKYSFMSREIAGFGNSFDNLVKNINEWRNNKYRVILLAGNETKCKNIVKELNDSEIDCIYTESLIRLPNESSVYVTIGEISAGFEYPDVKTVVISDIEMFGREKRRTRSSTKKQGIPVHVDSLKIGDYIVHSKHGIGIYLGIETLNAGGIVKDYIKIGYAKEDTLYIPIDQLENVSKYVGADGTVPRINKMGGQEWAKTKARVRAGLKDIADNLVKLYAKREMSNGFAFSPDTVWQQQFEDSFIYEETEDQLRCIDEIKKDMERKRPMDRLLCGDVGYGKTEVAIRAAFKAVMDGKQVAYLAPTTVLASQHYRSFVKRMGEYPVKVQVLSRLRTSKEQKEILRRLKTGEIDILIGTHRIAQKDVIFKDLGLLIIDEEQKFGVMTKEQIRMMKENVDVLTLSATPIPRTLHMSMVGVKDISVIYEPPSNRSPVQTYVFEYDRGIIREAITRELERNGQVYYLYNRVEDIERVAFLVSEDIQWARVAFAHGKMSPTELENIMLKFAEHEYDVLVCTTIIDSGVDIPNVNTIIVENAENLGLSQLYQLRGRVGRADRIAYAYITYRKNKSLSELATKRLNAIREFTEFGSGFKIAMRDLEIRGAGNLIGAEQHGHMDAVGYETYCKILEAMIKELRGEKVVEDVEEDVEVDLSVNAYIPDKYIHSEVQKMEMYQKIAKISDEEMLRDMIDELTDRYGDIPKETMRLLYIVELKYLAKAIQVVSIVGKNAYKGTFGNDMEIKIQLTFRRNVQLNMEVLSELVKEFRKGRMLFSAGETPYLTFYCDDSEDELLQNIKFVLQNINLLKNEL